MGMIGPTLAFVGIVAVVGSWPRLRGTTLAAPAAWILAALVVLAVVHGLIPFSNKVAPPWHGALRYVAAVTSLCPAMALFGAKRPQSSAWQFIVVSFLAILCWPVMRWWMLGDGETFEIHAAQRWFLLLVWLMVSANYLPTRFAVASIITAFAQLALLAGFFPSQLVNADRWLNILGLFSPMVGFVVAILLTAFGFPRRSPAAEPLDRLWLDFRDAYGAVWGLRIQQRVNQSAEMYGWPLQLEWQGFRLTGDERLSAETRKAVLDNLNNLLRRFVSPAWIAASLGQDVNYPADSPKLS